jgi:hypothetical protein
MNGLALIIIFICAAVAVKIQINTSDIIREQNRMRIWMMSSHERCPVPSKTSHCIWQIEARSHGEWIVCDESHPPSGADLPMHRWFRLNGRCPIELFSAHLKIPTVPMKIFR